VGRAKRTRDGRRGEERIEVKEDGVEEGGERDGWRGNGEFEGSTSLSSRPQVIPSKPLARLSVRYPIGVDHELVPGSTELLELSWGAG